MNIPPPSRAQRKIGPLASTRPVRQFPWTTEEDALLGKLTDREVTEKFNRTLDAVRSRRRFLARPAVGRAPQPFRMERESRDRYASLFSTKSDKELRAILGWSYARIRTWRRELSAHKLKKPAEWTFEEDRLLGTQPDPVLARLFGRSVSAVRARRGKKHIRLRVWRPEDDKILGTRTDREVALLLGRSMSNVAARRSQLGIPAKAKPRVWTPADIALIASKPVEEAARLLGRSSKAVRRKRRQLGLPPELLKTWTSG
jgi:hypothetical protein